MILSILRWISYVLPVMAAAVVICHRTPYLLKHSGVILVSGFFALAVCVLRMARKNRRGTGEGEIGKRRPVPFFGNQARFAAVLLGISCLTGLGLEAGFQWKKHRVRAADPQLLRRLGDHFIVGYESPGDRVGPSAGFFISPRNVAGKSHASVKTEIAGLKERSGALPVFVAADQEGGPVSRLSPPLPYLPAVSSCIDVSDWEKSERCIREYARKQGRGLVSLGVNLNLSPVTDLKAGRDVVLDLHTRIADRAMSPDPEVVTRAARIYCRVMSESGLGTTLKHFPGLGRVDKDTHHFSGVIDEAPEALEKSDWIPFRRISRETGAFIMLGHVIVRALDPEYHASHSEKIVGGLIRGGWKHDGLLITDDFCMNPVYFSDGGIGGAAVRALNAGVDIILISYHPERYYEAMYALLEAAEAGALNWTVIDKSAERLRRARGAFTAARSAHADRPGTSTDSDLPGLGRSL